MKNLLSITALALLALTSSCKKSADDTATTGNIPSAGWRIGTTNYTISLQSKMQVSQIQLLFLMQYQEPII